MTTHTFSNKVQRERCFCCWIEKIIRFGKSVNGTKLNKFSFEIKNIMQPSLKRFYIESYLFIKNMKIKFFVRWGSISITQ